MKRSLVSIFKYNAFFFKLSEFTVLRIQFRPETSKLGGQFKVQFKDYRFLTHRKFVGHTTLILLTRPGNPVFEHFY